jgi:hypothetical protein
VGQGDDERSGRCPTCGRGVLVDITYRDGSVQEGQAGEEIQEPDARQVETYSCGHEVTGPRLDATAADDRLDVERRSSGETTDPV